MNLIQILWPLASLMMTIGEGTGGMTVWVRDVARRHAVEVPSDSTVEDLREKANAQGVISGALMFHGRELQDNQLLADTGIASEAEVNVRKYSDLENLLVVFRETPETHVFREFVRLGLAPRDSQDDDYPIIPMEYVSDYPIWADADGNIRGIYLSNHQMTDFAIRDLSKLPSTLRQLVLRNNQLTKLDIAALPQGLEWLDLRDNKLIGIEVDPHKSRDLIIGLDGNHLKPVHFNKLAQDGFTQIQGRKQQQSRVCRCALM